jgi:geranylgeranyl reductase family protein
MVGPADSVKIGHMTSMDWNQPLAALPARCDVLVIGAGPAGSACAQVLARAGRHVVLVDAQAFPRDKTCGDGLVPDTHAALRRLGVHEQVMQRARAVRAARCVAPSGRHVDVVGELAVLPRRELDALLCRAAVQAGAQMVAPARFVAPLLATDGRVEGAVLQAGELSREVHARWVIIATGAGPAPLLAADMCERRTPSGMALRTYVRHPGMQDAVQDLRFVWHGRLQSGYGWIFPAPGHVFNIGVGILDSHEDAPSPFRRRRKRPNLRTLFDQFLAVEPLAARLMKEGEVLGELKGAPVRCDLNGAKWSRPGLLVTGEAAGATYSFTGEGIGKAMETAMAAADSLLAHDHQPDQPPQAALDLAVAAEYHARLHALLPRFQTYRQAASFNRWPWLVNVMIWRAANSPRILAKLGDILNERRLPGSLLTWRGVRNMLLP